VYNQLNGLAGAGRLAFTPSANNTVTVGYIDAAGWKATAGNPAVVSAASDVCGVYVGVAANSPDPAIKAEGAPACY
jgi:hypothetical protein